VPAEKRPAQDMVTAPSEDHAPPFNFRAETTPEMYLQKWGLKHPHLYFV